MKLKRWNDPRGVEMWVRDKKGRPSRMVFGARRKLQTSFELPEYVIIREVRSVEWVKRNYGI